jgi:hypothetical protein
LEGENREKNRRGENNNGCRSISLIGDERQIREHQRRNEKNKKETY